MSALSNSGSNADLLAAAVGDEAEAFLEYDRVRSIKVLPCVSDTVFHISRQSRGTLLQSPNRTVGEGYATPPTGYNVVPATLARAAVS